ncbi:site-specific integrase [Stigmatella erecta]|uniref:Phage integrase family protein n=1 Tax=Stigmatella erecta TaxID=83460 RepID=A0A1I0LBT5_9BACT|nr:site-specific integrase [Stigmatella erecta]SEU36998.1 Phage integrase family protein [Stigmatella erecta]
MTRAKKPKTQAKPKKTDTRQAELPLVAEIPTLGEIVEWYRKAHLSDPAINRNTRRGLQSTLRMALAHFGPEARPTLGQARMWLAQRVAMRELLPGGANSHRDRMHAVYTLAQQQFRPLLLNAFSFERFPGEKVKPEGLKDPARSWPKLLAAMPDDRARAFISLMRKRGFRLGEPLGLEWRHVKQDAPGGPSIHLEQQRDAWDSVPRPLKHTALAALMKLDKETARYLRSVQRSLKLRSPLFGSRTGALAGTAPCKDGTQRHYVFPYREKHLLELVRRARGACPEEFPVGKRGVRAGKMWHRLRHTYGTDVARTSGVEDAKKLLRHKYITSTQLYTTAVVGVPVSAEVLDRFDAAMEQQEQAPQEQSTVSACGGKSDTVNG